jgi:hypothetical protein
MEQSSSEAYSQEILCLFVEPESSLPCSQESTIDVYPKPDESSSHLLTIVL